MRTDPTFWIVARASGFTAYVLLSGATVAGLALKSRALGRRAKPTSVMDAHRFLAPLALLAIAVHGVALVYDTWIRIDLLGLLVPGRIPYRPLWVGSGVVAAELTVVVYLSFSIRKVIRVRNWRRLHWLTYGIFGAVTIHGLLAGSDSSHPWARDVYLGAIGSVATAVAYRILVRTSKPRLAVTRARRDHEGNLRKRVSPPPDPFRGENVTATRVQVSPSDGLSRSNRRRPIPTRGRSQSAGPALANRR